MPASAGLAAPSRRVKTTGNRHGYPIQLKRFARNFQATHPNPVWLADPTYIPTAQGWLCLATILDMRTRKIFGWCMRQTLHAEIAIDALIMIIQYQRPTPGLIHPSERGIK